MVSAEEDPGNRPFGRPKHKGKDRVKVDFKTSWRMRTDFIWLRIDTSGGVYCM